MRNLFIICVLSIIGSFNLNSQTYNEYTSLAMDLYKSKEFKESSKNWDKAFKIQKGLSSDYYNAACTNALAGNFEKAFDYLEKSIKNGWEDINWLKKDSDFESLKRLKKWDEFIDKIPQFKQEYINSLQRVDKLESEFFNEERIIKIHLPPNYNKNKKYPIIYTLDGHELFEITSDYQKYLAKYNVIPNSIVVSIFHTNRNYETTPNYGRDKNIPTNKFLEGAGKLKNHLFKEVIPFINTNYSTSGFNVLIGHSNTATLASQFISDLNNSFDGIVSITPDLLKTQIEDIKLTLQNKRNKNLYYFVSSGTKDNKYRFKTGKLLDSIFKRNTNPQIIAEEKNYNAGHVDLIVKSLNDALLFVFSDYRNYDDFENKVIENKLSVSHYLNEKNNLTVKNYGIPFNFMRDDFQYLLDVTVSKKNSEVLEQLFEATNKNNFFPKEEFYSQKAQIYEKMGLYNEALKNWKLQIEQGFNKNIFYYERSFNLIYKKLNRPEEAITFLENSIEIYPKGKLIFSFNIAKICAENNILNKKGLENIDYCVKFFEENNRFTLSEAMKIKKVLEQRK